MTGTLAFVHTSPVLVPTFSQLAAELLPGLKTFHMVDESLIKNTIATGSLSKATALRVLRWIEAAGQAGAAAVLVTCSSIGPAVSDSRPFIDMPVFRIDEAMASAAVAIGGRIGVAATLRTTLEPTLALLRTTASQAGRPVELVPALCEGAFEAVTGGKPELHDQIVTEKLRELTRTVDAVVLAQASMARVASLLPPGGAPVLSSPRLAMEQVRRELLSAV